MSKALFYLAIAAAVLFIALPFFPWVQMQSASLVLDGIHDRKFPNGTSYGIPGYAIITLSCVFIILHLLSSPKLKLLNLLVTGLLLAYSLRTYFLYTGSLFENEITKFPAVYGLTFLPVILLIAAIFPYRYKRKVKTNKP